MFLLMLEVMFSGYDVMKDVVTLLKANIFG